MKFPTTMEQIDFRKVVVVGMSHNGLLARIGKDIYARVKTTDDVIFYTLSGPANSSANIPGLYQKLNK